MPRFFYSASNLNNYQTPSSPWRRWRKKRDKKRALQRLDANLIKVQNPFKKEQKENRWENKIGIIAVIIFLITWIGLMIYLPYFRIVKTNFTGLNIIKENEISDFVQSNFINSNKFFPKNNYFLLNKEKVETKIKENFVVESVIVEKLFPNRLNINLIEKNTSVIYDNGAEYILLDENGNFIKSIKAINDSEFFINATTTTNNSQTTTGTENDLNLASTLAAKTIASSTPIIVTKTHIPDITTIQKECKGGFPIIYDRRLGKTESKNLEKEIVAAVLTWKKMLSGGEVGELRYFVLENTAAGLQIKTSNPWDILISINGNHENAFNNLRSIIKDNTPREYIDLRYGERVYWK